MYQETDENYFKKQYIKGATSISNNVFERKLFSGLKTVCGEKNVIFISAPSFGWYPFNCKRLIIKCNSNDFNFRYVKYISTYLGNTLSKANALKKEIKKIIRSLNLDEINICLIINELHLPYLSCAKYLKNHIPECKTIQLVPDLPEFNNRSKKYFYRILKNINCKKIEKLRKKYVDYYVLFSEPMAEKLLISDKNNWIVNYGITPKKYIAKKNIYNDGKKHVVFIGKLDYRNGIDLIIATAKSFNKDNIIFDLYGIGASDSVDNKMFNNVSNVKIHGFVNPSEVKDILLSADILLSPRYASDEYTKYSFPSKIFEYLSTDKPIITFKLDCYPQELDDLLIYPTNMDSKSLCDCILGAFNVRTNILARDVFLNNFSEEAVAKRIVKLAERKL